MTRIVKPKQKERSLAKGIAAGLLGGLAGAIALTFAQRFFASRAEAAPKPLEPVTTPKSATAPSRALAIARPAAEINIDAIPWGYGALTGAAYGALAEFFPAATSKEGASFGMTLEALTQQGAIPALGVVVRERKAAPSDAAAGITAHVAFGVTTEWVRRIIRKLL